MHFSSLLLTLTAATAASAFYYPTFLNLNGAINLNAPDFLAFVLVSTISDCFLACNKVPGCKFVNTYHDVNGNGGNPDLTCSMYKSCHYANTATNKGGQTEPSGLPEYIIESDGWCKFYYLLE
ncbi:fruit-body specific protein A [Amanita rubescens]|nr:fruit-body specific protein A [Amanita rubescens]